MPNLPKVLVTDLVDPLLLDGLQAAGFNCDYLPNIALKETLACVANYRGLIINSKIIVDKHFLDTAVQLQFIARLGSGLEIIDLEYAQKKGVAVHRSPDGNCDAVAEHAMGMLLSLANNLCKCNQQVRQKIWQREANRGWELMGKTVGILGFGFTGRAFAQRLAGFGVKVLAYDKYKTNFAKDLPQVFESSLEQIFEEVDILSLHLPLTTETIGMVEESFLAKFKKPIVLINTARGEILKTAALLQALDSQKVLGACLDVFENEKTTTYSEEQERLFSDLFERDNVLLSPHVAGWTQESKKRLASLLLQRILSQSPMI